MVKRNIRIKWSGSCKIKAYDRSGRLVYQQIGKNKFLNDGKDVIAKFIGGIETTGKLTRIGVGDSSEDVSFSDDELIGTNTEIKDIGDRNYVRPTLVVGVEFLFTEANFIWREAGLYAGTILVARALFSPEFGKTNLIRGSAEWTITIG